MQKIFLLLLTVALGLNLSAQDVSLPCDTTNCSLLKYDGNDDGMVNYEDFLEMLGAYGSADVDGDCIEDSQDDCVEDGCGVCDGPGPTVQVVDTIVFIADSTFTEVLNEWYVFEVPDTTFTFVCSNPGCIDPMAENYDPYASENDGSCWGGLTPCDDGSTSVTFDGYTYDLVGIEGQCWFAENLRTEHYANGDAIPGELTDGEWSNTTNGAMTVYGEGTSPVYYGSDDEVTNLADYGRLYTWYAVVDARGLCPSGWHVPTDGEFMTLEMELGLVWYAADYEGWRGNIGIQMKSSPENSPSWNGANTSGFSGLAGGNRRYNGHFYDEGDYGYFWSASNFGVNAAWIRILGGDNVGVARQHSQKTYGYSVRCVRD